MKTERNTVIHLYQRVPELALRSLNRLTGLSFSHWPESLVALCAQDEPAGQDASAPEKLAR
ncbi:hypothetical protein YO5_10405 [Stutzerimonas stutzeri TS44]|nr:hypothetical protein YO5_10405 [Stutzerimonas stutzeri TS44]